MKKKKNKRSRPICPMWDIPKDYRKCKICKYYHEHKCEYLEWEGELDGHTD